MIKDAKAKGCNLRYMLQCLLSATDSDIQAMANEKFLEMKVKEAKLKKVELDKLTVLANKDDQDKNAKSKPPPLEEIKNQVLDQKKDQESISTFKSSVNNCSQADASQLPIYNIYKYDAAKSTIVPSTLFQWKVLELVSNNVVTNRTFFLNTYEGTVWM